MTETGFLHDPANDINLLQDLLRNRYRNRFDIIKELLQNADDAKATEMHLGWSEGLPEATHPLLHGPAVFAANNGPFTTQHANAIRRLGLNAKASDPGAIGKFGLGLKSVFHVCEAFFYASSTGYDAGDGVRRKGNILNPWSETGVHEEWNFLADEDLALLLTHLDRVWHGGEWFVVWVPLRTRAHCDGCEPIMSGAFLEDLPDLRDELFPSNFDRRIGSYLPLLRWLRRVSIWAIGNAGTASLKCFGESDIGRSKRRVFDRSPLTDRLPCFTGRVRIGPSDEPSPGTDLVYAGQEGWVPELDRTDKKDWPHVFSLDENGKAKFGPEKAFPHCAVVFTKTSDSAKQGRLTVCRAVFLPLADSEESRPWKGSVHVFLALHGYFFVDAGRRDIEGGEGLSANASEESAVSVPHGLRDDWNRRLLTAGTLTLVLPALVQFVQEAALPEPEITGLTKALKESWLFRGSLRRHVCAAQQWVCRLVPQPPWLSWLPVPACEAIFELPRPPKDRSIPFTTLAKLQDMCRGRCVTYQQWPRLALQENAAWSEADLVELIASAEGERLITEGCLDYLASFLEQCLPSPPQATVADALVSLCKNLLSRLGRKSAIDAATQFKRIGRNLPPERRVVLATDLSQGCEALACLNLLVPRIVLLPKDLEPGEDSDRSSGRLNRAEALKVLQEIATFPNAVRTDLAAAVLRLCPNADDVLRDVTDLALFRAEDLSRSNRGLLVSFRDLQTRYAQHCLFLKVTDNTLAEDLQKAIVNRPVVLLEKNLASLLFDREKLRPCNAESCEAMLLREPPLAAPSQRSDLLRHLVGPLRQCPSVTFRQAIRYLLHGKQQCDHEEALYVAHPGIETVWSRIVEYGLNLKDAGWRWVDGRLAERLSKETRAWLGVQQVDRDGAICILEEAGAQAFALKWTDEDYETLLMDLRDQKPLLSDLSIHPDAEAARHRIEKSKTFWKGQFPLDAKLRGLVTILEPKSDAALKAIQRSLASSWSANDALRLVTAQPHPGKYWRIILEALADRESVPEEFEAFLRSKAWLPRKDEPLLFIQPDHVLLLEGLDDELARATTARQTDYIDAARLAPEVKAHHRGYRVVCEHLFPGPEETLAQLAELLASTEEYRLGRLPTLNEEDLGDLLDAFADTPSGFIPSCELITRVPTSISRSDLLKYYVPPLQRADLTKDRLLAILNFLAGQHDREASRSNTIFKVHGWYLSQLAKLICSTTAPPELRLLPQSGPRWRLPAELCWGEENIADSHRLCEVQRQILRPNLGRGSTSLSDSDSRDDAVPANTPKGVSQDLGHAIETSAKTLLDYFAPWKELVPYEVLGLLFCVLGEHSLLRQAAVKWLGIHHPLRQTREDMALQTGPEGIHAFLHKCRFVAEIIGKRATVSNLLGQPFEAPLSDRCEQLVVDYSPDARIPSRRWNGSRVYWVRFREFHPRSYADTNGSSALLKVLRETLQRLVCDAYHQDPTAVRVYEVFDRLSQATQQGITAAQRLIIDHGLLYLRQQLAPVPEPLATLFKEWDRARHRLYEEEEVAHEGRSLPSGHSADKRMRDIRDRLRQQIERDQRVQELLVKAVQRKISDCQYREHSIPFELFQNADDAYEELNELVGPASPEAPEGRFIVLSELDTLTFAHAGRLINQYRLGGRSLEDRGFDRDLEKMLVLSSSDKPTVTPEATGKFGLGFKSVFLLADRPKLLSGALAFEIVAGMYPLALSQDETGRLRSLAHRLGMGGATLTLVQLGLREPGAGERALQRFRRLLPILLAFARRVHRCDLEVGEKQPLRLHWKEEQVPNASGACVGRLTQPCEGELGSLRALVIRAAQGSLLVRLGQRGVDRLPETVPTVWVTAPTGEELDVGFAVNGAFAPDVGRERLSGTSRENDELADQLGRSLGDKLLALFDASEGDKWPMFRGALGLEEGSDPYEFWLSVWRVFVAQYRPKVSGRPNDPAIRVIQTMLWATDAHGLARLYLARPALPTALEPLPFRRTLRVAQVRFHLTGYLDRHHDLFVDVVAWPSCREKGLAEATVSDRVWAPLRQLLPHQGVAKLTEAHAVRLHDLLSWERDRSQEVGAERAKGMGKTITRRLLREIKESHAEERDQLKDILDQFAFQCQDGVFRRPAGLLALQPGGEQNEETLRSQFAPDNRVLAESYNGTSLEFFLVCRGGMAPPTKEMAEWALAVQSDDRRSAVLQYLRLGEFRDSFSQLLRDRLASSPDNWLSQIESNDLFTRLPNEQRIAILLSLGGYRDTSPPPPLLAPPPPAPPPRQQLDPKTVLKKIHQWWTANREQYVAMYESWVYPKGWPDVRRDVDWSDKEQRKAWLTVFLLASCHTLGRTRFQRDRNFVQLCDQLQILDRLAEAEVDPAGWLLRLEEYLESKPQWVQYYHWMKLLPGVFFVARKIANYGDAFLQAEKINQPFSLDHIISPNTSQFLDFTGPSLQRVLGMGACFIMRECARKNIIRNPHCHPHCFVPHGKVRRLFEELGCPGMTGREVDSAVYSRQIHEFLSAHLEDEKVTFQHCFDLPFLILAYSRRRKHKLHMRVFGRELDLGPNVSEVDRWVTGPYGPYPLW